MAIPHHENIKNHQLHTMETKLLEINCEIKIWQ